MAERIIYEYCILRYVPDIEREEFINVGLMMMCKRFRWMKVIVNPDESKIKSISSKADIKRLRHQLELFIRTDVPFPDLAVEERYRWMAAVKSAIIQTSPSHPGILKLPSETSRQEISGLLDQKFDELFKRLVI